MHKRNLFVGYLVNMIKLHKIIKGCVSKWFRMLFLNFSNRYIFKEFSIFQGNGKIGNALINSSSSLT